MGITEVQEIKITKPDGGETIVGLAVRVGRDIIVNFHVKFQWGEKMLENAIREIYRLYLARHVTNHHSKVRLGEPVKIVCAGDFNMGEDKIKGLVHSLGYTCEFHETTVIAEGNREISEKFVVDHVFSLSLRKCAFCEKTLPIHVSAPDECYSNPKNKINELCPKGSKCRSYTDKDFMCQYLIHPVVDCVFGVDCRSLSSSYFTCRFAHPPQDTMKWRESGGGGGGGGA
jgi:hypothetical protein